MGGRPPALPGGAAAKGRPPALPGGAAAKGRPPPLPGVAAVKGRPPALPGGAAVKRRPQALLGGVVTVRFAVILSALICYVIVTRFCAKVLLSTLLFNKYRLAIGLAKLK